ncbi:hypothetical protein F5Y17DRAFT_454784 [Xylariaceae sp. FL0594]|nr:hypothetical protein F5Y17DRAFT_454784 [Xylariaceae sp. FL0594]
MSSDQESTAVTASKSTQTDDDQFPTTEMTLAALSDIKADMKLLVAAVQSLVPRSEPKALFWCRQIRATPKRLKLFVDEFAREFSAHPNVTFASDPRMLTFRVKGDNSSLCLTDAIVFDEFRKNFPLPTSWKDGPESNPGAVDETSTDWDWHLENVTFAHNVKKPDGTQSLHLFNASSLKEGRRSASMGRYVLIFTVVTILYLPPSFISTVLDMQIFQKDVAQTKWEYKVALVTVSLSTYLVALISIVAVDWEGSKRRGSRWLAAAIPLWVFLSSTSKSAEKGIIRVWTDTWLRVSQLKMSPARFIRQDTPNASTYPVETGGLAASHTSTENATGSNPGSVEMTPGANGTGQQEPKPGNSGPGLQKGDIEMGLISG